MPETFDATSLTPFRRPGIFQRRLQHPIPRVSLNPGAVMHRSTAVLLVGILFLFPFSGEGAAQDVPGGEQRYSDTSHVVRAGETLESIAREHYGSPGEWQRILEANRDRIPDPQRLTVGMTLVLPAMERAAARVTGIQVGGQEVPVDPRDRRALLQRRPFVPAGVPEAPGERTIFYDDRTHLQEDQLTQVLVLPREEVPAIPTGVALAGGWTVAPGESLGAWGSISGFAGGDDARIFRNTLLPYDEVRVILEDGVRVDVGDSLLVARVNRELPEVGRVMGPTGVLVVQRLEGAGVIGRMVAGLGKAELGNLVFPQRTFFMAPGVYPSSTERPLEASILAFQEIKELYQPGDFLFIDRGAVDGLVPGDEFIAPGGLEEGWDGRWMAQFQVVWVEEERATLRILSTHYPGSLRAGNRVLLDRTMP
jgi:hypothetical protein